MSANNVVWVMYWTKVWHVFYSGCMDNDPEEPDYNDKYYKMFEEKDDALIYAHRVVDKIDADSALEGHAGVEYGVCVVPLSIEERAFMRSKPVLDALYIQSKTVTNKDIQEFVRLVEAMVNRLNTELILKENRIKERLCILENESREGYAEHIEKAMSEKSTPYPDPPSEVWWNPDECRLEFKPRKPQEEGWYIFKNGKKVWRHPVRDDWGLIGYIDRPLPIPDKKPSKRKDGCYQFTYCNECLAYPMGLGCPNLTKGPVQLKDEVKHYDGKTWGKE